MGIRGVNALLSYQDGTASILFMSILLVVCAEIVQRSFVSIVGWILLARIARIICSGCCETADPRTPTDKCSGYPNESIMTNKA